MSSSSISNVIRTTDINSAIINNFIYKKYATNQNVNRKYFTINYQDDKKENLIQDFLNIGYKLYYNIVVCQYILLSDKNLVNFSYNSYICDINILGEKDKFNEIEELILTHYTKYNGKNIAKIRWCFLNDSNRIETMETNLEEKNPPFTEMYPFLQGESLEEYYNRYDESSASILLLQGPPGTGKTTFIRGLLHHLKKSALLSYDDAILRSDNFLNLFLNDKGVNYLVFEDADAYLTSRESGNRMIHKFLNAGDGLISSKNKKIIFTTNLKCMTDIDEALTRPGRCFDILQFRPLTKIEAITVAQKKGEYLELPEKDFTIAEIFNTQSYTKKKIQQPIGFAL